MRSSKAALGSTSSTTSHPGTTPSKHPIGGIESNTIFRTYRPDERVPPPERLVLQRKVRALALAAGTICRVVAHSLHGLPGARIFVDAAGVKMWGGANRRQAVDARRARYLTGHNQRSPTADRGNGTRIRPSG